MRDVYKELKELDYFAYIDTIQKADAIANSCFKQNISTKEGRDGAYEIEQSLVKMKLLELRTNNVVERSEQLKAEDKDLPFADYLEKWYELPRYEKVYDRKDGKGTDTEDEVIKNYRRAFRL